MYKILNPLLLLFFLTLLNVPSVKSGDEIGQLSKHPVVIIISYDGFRYDYLSKTETPHLDSLKGHGVSVPYMRNQFVTSTFPNHHSIATGLYIESHGVVGNNGVYDPLYNISLSGFNDDPGFWNYSTGVLPLWVVNELAGDDRASGVMMWPGCAEPFGPNDTKATYIKKYERNYTFESRFDDVIAWITNKNKPANLVMAYFQEPDSTGHKFGPEGPEMIKQIQKMDNLTGYFIGKLKSLDLWDKVNLIFLSDHGMQEVKGGPDFIIPYKNLLQNENNKTYFTYGRSPVLQILPVQENETTKIFNAFDEASANSNFKAYLKSNLVLLKPNWHYSNSRRIMPILLVAEPGYVFEDISQKNFSTGTHGYDSETSTMRPYFIAAGPLFKSNSIEKPFDNIDVYPLVCHIMGIEPPPNNGSLEHVLPLLITSWNLPPWLRGTGGLLLEIIGSILLALAIGISGFLLYRRCRRSRSNSMEMVP